MVDWIVDFDTLGATTEEAVKKLSVDFPQSEHVSKSRDSREMYEQFSSLEEPHPSPQELHFQDPPSIIR